MFNKKSDYALNKKDPDAIVYPSADGKLIRLTRDDFGSEDAFIRFKLWSDENYHITDNEDHAHAKRQLSLEGLSDEAVCTPAVDTFLEEQHDRLVQFRSNAELVEQIKSCMTEIQFRRLWMFCVDGMTESEIAKVEGVGQRRVSTSLTAARKRIKKFFQIP